jgi:hypothetical protein
MKSNKDYVWVGNRLSDIRDTNLFEKSIILFGSGEGVSSFEDHIHTRINHNRTIAAEVAYINEQAESILTENANTSFMFYNPCKAYSISDSIVERTICLNNQIQLNELTDKAMVRLWLGNSGCLLPYFVAKFNELSYEIIQNRYPNYTKYVIQSTMSSGGEGTFLITAKSDLERLYNSGELLVSPYLDNSIALNAHAIIYNNCVVIFPLSVQLSTINVKGQIIYHGNDFISYRHIKASICENAEQQAHCIAEKLRHDGYRGIVGIDFLVHNNEVYFMEINPRFQGSSAIVNRTLKQKNLPSLHSMNLESFIKDVPAVDISGIEINYSCFCNHVGDQNTVQHFIRLQQSSEITSNGLAIDVDNYAPECNAENGAYAYRLVFPYSISSSADWYGTRLHPNLYTDYSNIEDQISVKIELLNGGYYISNETSRQVGVLRKGTFTSHDIEMFETLTINCPTSKFNILSPYTIEVFNNALQMRKLDKYISAVSFERPHSTLIKEIRKGLKIGDIAFLSTDRLRISHSPVCKYKKDQIGCRFCSTMEHPRFDINDVFKAIDICLNEIEFRHFLIGGGSAENEVETIINLLDYIHTKSDKPTYIMCLPPKKKNLIRKLYDHGASELAFNMELYSPKYAALHMPGKSTISRVSYLSALEYAVSLWGDNGNVRSILIAGLEPMDITLAGVQKLCEIGVQPILSVFRPMVNTDTENIMPLSNEELNILYKEASKICETHNQILGPTCIHCRNNTLS